MTNHTAGWMRISMIATWLGAGTAVAQSANGGGALFDAYGCYQCHGHVGQGGAAPRLAPSQYPFEAFAAFVRRPVNEMPAYAPAVLSEANLRAIYDYMRATPAPPAIATIRILR